MSKNIVDNPCYHCYTGAIGECTLAKCKYNCMSWSKDLDSTEIEISDFDIICTKIYELYDKLKNNNDFNCSQSSPGSINIMSIGLSNVVMFSSVGDKFVLRFEQVNKNYFDMSIYFNEQLLIFITITDELSFNLAIKKVKQHLIDRKLENYANLF